MSLPTPSVQLYTLVEEFRADPARSLDRLAAIGLRHVEAFDFVGRPAEIRAALDASGLTAPTGHAPLLSTELWTPAGTIASPEPEAVLEAAAILGLTTVIDPFVEPVRWASRDGVAEIADRLNEVAELAATYGLNVGYHNHAQEFLIDIDGVSALEYVVARTDERVAIELDLFWALTGGQDVPALVQRLGSRLLAVHVKDGFVPAENPFAPGVDRALTLQLDQRRPGEGEVPLIEAMRATDAVRWAVIEYDQSPGDVFDDIAASYAFLLEKGLAA